MPVSVRSHTLDRRSGPYPAAVQRHFQLILIKPSHYDDDGYVIRWWRAMIPSNSLAALYGIAADCAARQVLGADVTIDIDAIDELNTRVDILKLLARLRANAGFGLVALVGVQSNQYPRALDIARPFREAGFAVAMGGFHISGCLSMLDGSAVDLDACREMGIAMFAGEAEGRLDMVLRDTAAGKLEPVYDFLKDLPGLEDTPEPILPARYVQRTLGQSTSFDAGRGCPYQCSFCTIINVQGRKSRSRSPDDVERLVRANWAQGIHKFFITDDNFARNKDWEPIFDRLIELREQHAIPLGLLIQVDTLCHKIPNFIAKAKRAGVTRVFIGLENVNPDNLIAAKKRQNKITEYRKMLLAWKAQGHHHDGRLHPGLSCRHGGNDPPRHRDHQARTSARHAGVLLPDAAAGVGGSSDALAKRHRDGRRSEPLRPGARLHGPSAHEPRGMAGHL